jgi:aerobic carbon-monoxide dehydrogenase medium subunit
MKAAAFNYARAASVEEAVAMLAGGGERAKLLAGGQSLLPALNLRLMSLDLLVDITGISALRGITIEGGTVKIGALTRHADLLASHQIAEHAPLLAKAVAHIAHPAIRNRGTIGGNLAHADPASELPACMQVLGATMVLRGPSGERRVGAADFSLGLYQTALAADELLVAVEFPAIRRGERAYFHEFARRLGDYAIIGLAAQAEVEGDGIGAVRLAYFGVGDRAGSCPAAARLLQQRYTPDALADAQRALAQDLQPHGDHQASGAMRLHLARILLARCVHEWLGRSAVPDGATA